MFAEVKSSENDSNYFLGLRVGLKKQKRIIATASDYMLKHNPTVSGYRFDVILVQRVSTTKRSIQHIKSAFCVEDDVNYE